MDSTDEAYIFLAKISIRQGKYKMAASYLSNVSKSVKSMLKINNEKEVSSGAVLFGMIIRVIEKIPDEHSDLKALKRDFQDRLDRASRHFKNKNYTKAISELDLLIEKLSKL